MNAYIESPTYNMAKCNRCEKNEKLDQFDKCVECIKYILSKPDSVISNVLAYVNSHRHGGSRLKIIETCLKEFSEEVIELGKKVLYKEYEYVLGNPQKRVGSPKRSKADFIMEDIFDALEALDSKGIKMCCVADEVKLLPKYNPEEVDLTSMLERIIKLENKTKVNERKIEESYVREVQDKSIVEESQKKIDKAKAELENCLKMVSDTQDDVQKHVTEVETVKSEIESVKLSYADKLKESRSNARNEASGSSSGATTGSNASYSGARAGGQQHRPQHNRGDNVNSNRYNSRRSYYGNSAGSGGNVGMGAPLPSRYVVIERVKKEITKEDVKRHTDSKRTELRSVKLMSRAESMFKRYLLEISVKDLNNVVSEEFWPPGVRVRIFRGRVIDIYI